MTGTEEKRPITQPEKNSAADDRLPGDVKHQVCPECGYRVTEEHVDAAELRGTRFVHEGCQ